MSHISVSQNSPNSLHDYQIHLTNGETKERYQIVIQENKEIQKKQEEEILHKNEGEYIMEIDKLIDQEMTSPNKKVEELSDFTDIQDEKWPENAEESKEEIPIENEELKHEENNKVNWEDFDLLDYTTKNNVPEPQLFTEEDEKGMEPSQEIIEMMVKDSTQSEMNKLEKIQSEKLMKISPLTYKLSNQVVRSWNKQVQRRLKSIYVSSFNDPEFLSPEYTSRVSSKSKNICNFNCTDIEDYDNILQEFSGIYEEEEDLQTIEELSIEMAENSEAVSHRTSFSHYTTQNQEENNSMILKGNLNYFKGETPDFEEMWWEITETSLICFEDNKVSIINT